MYGRKDRNHNDIKQALIDTHLSVADLADVPLNLPELTDLPDLLVGGYHQTLEIPYNALIEIKTADGKLQPGQKNFIETWRGPVFTVRTVDEALAVFGIKANQ